MYLVKAFSRFSFTPNVLMYIGLRKVGEAVKAINENLLTRARTREGKRVKPSHTTHIQSTLYTQKVKR